MKRLNSNQGKHWLWAVLFMIGISGCTDDSLREEAGKDDGSASGKAGYIVLDVAADGGSAATRAWNDGEAGQAGDEEFDKGSEGEQAMAPDPGAHWVILFNEDGSFHSMEELNLGKKPEDDTETHPGHDKETVISRFVGQFVKGEGHILPKKLLVVLNADPKLMTEVQGKFPEGTEKNAEDILLSYLTDKMTNKDFKEGKWPAIFYTPSDGKTNYCTMSNTTYADSLDKDVITLQDIPEEAIQDTEEQAAEHPIRVHVERLAVKVELAVKDVEVSDKPVVIEPKEKEDKEDIEQKDDEEDEAESVKWSVLIRGWSTSGIARRMYLFKNLDDGKHCNDGIITSDFFDFWNAWERFRCYWAVDDSYHNPSVYPTQYREAEDKRPYTKPYEGLYDDNGKESPLYYYSYNEITNLSAGKTPDGKDKEHLGNLLSSKVHRYCPENTLGEELLKGKTYRSASTHVIITAQLLFDEEDKAEDAIEDAKKVSDKYHADGFWWDREGYIRHACNKLLKALKAGGSFEDIFGGDSSKIEVPENVKIYVVSKDNKEEELNGEYLKDKSEEELPFTLDEARIVGGDGRQMLALKDGWTLKLKNGENGNGENGEKDIEIDEETFLSMVYAFVGYTDLFKQGMMYYWIPIRHVQGGDRSQGWKLGDIGVVRNHWYKFNITSVIRPGIPVDDPDDPLIPDEPHDPPEEPTEAYLGLEVRILPWHIIEQNVELGEDIRHESN